MTSDKADIADKTITRRQFIKRLSVGAAVLGAAGVAPVFIKPARASRNDHILIGQPAPLTGPLSAFGEPTLWMKDQAERMINREGGIYVKSAGKKLPVKIIVLDTRSDPNKAAEAAARLCLGDKVDLMVVMHSPTAVDPVTAACERYQTPCLALDAPLDSFRRTAPHKWAFQAFWDINEDIIPVYTGMWEQIANNKKVGLLFAGDLDAVTWSRAFNEALPAKGYSVVDRGLFMPESRDFTRYISTWKEQNVEIITGNLTPPDWITCWRQCHRMGFKPRIATIGRAILFPSVMEALGPQLGVGLTSEMWWSPALPYKSPRTGLTSAELAGYWSERTHKQWTQPLGYDHAGYELVEDVLKRSPSLDNEDLRQSIAETDLETMIGPIKYNESNYCRTPVVGGQWVKGDKFPFDMKVVYNGGYPQVPRGRETHITVGITTSTSRQNPG